MSLHYNGARTYLWYKNSEESEISATPLCLRNISKDWPVGNVKKTGLNEYVYYFSADYNDIAVDDILNTCKWLIKKMI